MALTKQELKEWDRLFEKESNRSITEQERDRLDILNRKMDHGTVYREEFIKKAQENFIDAADVLMEWGIPTEFAQAHGIGYYDPSDADMEDLFIKMVEEDGTKYEKVRVDTPQLVITDGRFLVLRDQNVYDEYNDTKPKIICPTPNNKNTTYNTSSLYRDNIVYICTKIADTLAYMSEGQTAAYIPAESIGNFTQYLRDKKIVPKAQVIISTSKFLDDDATEEEAEKYVNSNNAIVQAFASVPMKVYASHLSEYREPGEDNLINVFINDRQRFARSIMADLGVATDKADKEYSRYIRSGAGSLVDDFAAYIENNAKKEAISTGFPNLDDLLDGGIRDGQLIVCGALSSLGKTTFILQMADNMVMKGNYVQFFTLENGKFEMMGKSISRLTYQQCKNWQEARSYTDIMYRSSKWTDDQRNSVNKALDIYRIMAQDRLHFVESNEDVYPQEPDDDKAIMTEAEKKEREKARVRSNTRIGVQDIRKAVEDHIRIIGEKPVVFVDYLQIIDAKSDQMSDKAKMDFVVTTLRTMARDLQVPVIVVSSLNRDNYNAEVTFSSFKESGIIEYSSDIVIGLQYEGMSGNDVERKKGEKSKSNRDIIKEQRQKPVGEPKDIELVLLKNRYGRRGTAYFSFLDLCSFFAPKDKRPDWEE